MAMLWIKVLLMCSLSGTASVYAYKLCRPGTYRDTNGGCQPCPDHCESCDSNVNCTECQNNYWGLTCHRECSQQCSGRCHKEFGHCTGGCPDGTFPRHGSAECITCGPTCKVCSSSSNCFRCRPRFYGPDCQSCSDTCVDNRCNMTTGECYACRRGYFSEDGVCQKCIDGCASCIGRGHCTKCYKPFYGPYIRKCLLECQNTDTPMQFLTSPDDRCGIPNGQMSHNAQACRNVSRDQSYTCSSARYCLMDKQPLKQDDDNNARVCLRVILEVCFAKCRPSPTEYHDDVNHLCDQTCKYGNVSNERNDPVCFHVDDNTHDSYDDIKVGNLLSTINILCVIENDDTLTPDGDTSTYFEALIIVSGICLFTTSTILFLLIRRYKSRKSTTRGAIHSTETNDEHVTTDLEDGNMPFMTHSSQQQDVTTTTTIAEIMSTPRGQLATWREDHIDETGMIPLRNLGSVLDEERTRTDVTAGMTSRMNQPRASREEYMTLGVDVEVHNYESLETRDNYVDCEVIRPILVGDVNSREATGTSCDYLTPM